MKYSQQIDRKSLEKLVIDGRFDELALLLNTTLLSPDDVERGEVTYRHLREPMKYNLRAEKDQIVISGAGHLDSDGNDWFPAESFTLRYRSTVDSMDNFDSTGEPVVFLTADVGMVGCYAADAGVGGPTRVCFGVSADGISWTPLQQTSRPFGPGNGSSVPFYDSPSQNHYIFTSVGGYFPVNYPSDKPVRLFAAGGGTNGMWVPSAYEYYTIMFNEVAGADTNGWAWMRLLGRALGA